LKADEKGSKRGEGGNNHYQRGGARNLRTVCNQTLPGCSDSSEKIKTRKKKKKKKQQPSEFLVRSSSKGSEGRGTHSQSDWRGKRGLNGKSGRPIRKIVTGYATSSKAGHPPKGISSGRGERRGPGKNRRARWQKVRGKLYSCAVAGW